MAFDYIYLAHRRAGVAIWLSKQLSNDWSRTSGITEAWNTLMRYLHGQLEYKPSEEEHHAFWDGFNSGEDEFVLIQEQSFGKTWTTPSGLLNCKDDYINHGEGDRDYDEPAIFEVAFLSGPQPQPPSFDVAVGHIRPHPDQATTHPGTWAVQLSVSRAPYPRRVFWRWYTERNLDDDGAVIEPSGVPPTKAEILEWFWDATFSELHGFDLGRESR